MTRSRIVMMCGVLLLLIAPEAGAEESVVTGKVESVTLSRGRALVTRVINVDGPAGHRELVVAGLPQRIAPESLYAEPSDGLFVRAVRFRSRVVEKPPSDALAKIDQDMEAVQRNIARAQAMLAMYQQREEFLGGLETFTAGAAKDDLERGRLAAGQLREIAKFSFDERRTLVEDRLREQGELIKENRALQLLNQKRNLLAVRSGNVVREAVLFLEKSAAGKVALRLSYQVDGAGWTPVYTVRAGAPGGKVRVDYDAVIRQMTGEDWKGVQLALSTATPALGSQGPALAPFRVTLRTGASRQQKKAPAQYEQQLRDLQGRLQSGLKQQQAATDITGNLGMNWSLNKLADRVQVLELDADKAAFKQARRAAGPREGLSVRYPIEGRVSLQSRADQQLVRIARMEMDARFYHVATPVLTSWVYREAELLNDSGRALLAGPVSAYLEGRFVGRGEIPDVAPGQMFVVGFGSDSRLRASRELVERVEDVQGGNRKITFTYRLVVENFQDRDVQLRLLDRMPVAERGSDIRITLGKLEDELSKEKLYQRLERPRGILRWDVVVARGAAGDKAATVLYSYMLEYDRNLALASPNQKDAPRMEEDFRKMLHRRSASPASER